MAARPSSSPPPPPPPFDLPATVVAAAAAFAAYAAPPPGWRWTWVRPPAAAGGEGVAVGEPAPFAQVSGDSSSSGGDGGRGGGDGDGDGGGSDRSSSDGRSDGRTSDDGTSLPWRVRRAAPPTLGGEHGWGGRPSAAATATDGEAGGGVPAAAAGMAAPNGAPGDTCGGSPSGGALAAAATAAEVGTASEGHPGVHDGTSLPTNGGEHTSGRSHDEHPRDGDGRLDRDGDSSCGRPDADARDSLSPPPSVTPPRTDTICLEAATSLPLTGSWASLVAKVAGVPAGGRPRGGSRPPAPYRRLETVAFLESRTTATQGWVWVDATRREVVVAFRGTEGARWKDLLTDTMAWWVPFAPGGPIHLGGKGGGGAREGDLPPIRRRPPHRHCRGRHCCCDGTRRWLRGGGWLLGSGGSRHAAPMGKHSCPQGLPRALKVRVDQRVRRGWWSNSIGRGGHDSGGRDNRPICRGDGGASVIPANDRQRLCRLL